MNNYDVLIIDDEIVLGEATEEYFNMFDIKTKFIKSASDCLEFLKDNSVRLILLDINLDNESGFDLCKTLRLKYSIPILFISARLSDDDILMALNIGGDDYITKPYSLSVLLAKVKVRLKKNEVQNELKIGNLKIDYEKLKVYKNGVDLELKTMEFKLLTYLVANKDKVVKKEELFLNVWNVEYYSDGTLNVHIRKLREKIEDNPDNPKIIKTVWGVGYVFESE